MANLIDTTYFINEINVAQADYPPVEKTLTDIITKYEPYYLLMMLGNQLHKDFIDGLAEAVIEQRWIDLRDGADFIDSAGTPWKWGGFVNTDKISPIAYFVYFHWLRKEAQVTTGVGEGSLQGENIIRLNPVRKQVTIWNQLVEMDVVLLKFLLAHPDEYGDIKCSPVRDNLLTLINEFNI